MIPSELIIVKGHVWIWSLDVNLWNQCMNPLEYSTQFLASFSLFSQFLPPRISICHSLGMFKFFLPFLFLSNLHDFHGASPNHLTSYVLLLIWTMTPHAFETLLCHIKYSITLLARCWGCTSELSVVLIFYHLTSLCDFEKMINHSPLPWK